MANMRPIEDDTDATCQRDGALLDVWEERPFCTIYRPCGRCGVAWIEDGKAWSDARDVLTPKYSWNRAILEALV